MLGVICLLQLPQYDCSSLEWSRVAAISPLRCSQSSKISSHTWQYEYEQGLDSNLKVLFIISFTLPISPDRVPTNVRSSSMSSEIRMLCRLQSGHAILRLPSTPWHKICQLYTVSSFIQKQQSYHYSSSSVGKPGQSILNHLTGVSLRSRHGAVDLQPFNLLRLLLYNTHVWYSSGF